MLDAETLLTLARAAEWMACTSEHSDRDGRCAAYLYNAADAAREEADTTTALVTAGIA